MNNTENKSQIIYFQYDVILSNPAVSGGTYPFVLDTKNLQCQNGIVFIPKIYFTTVGGGNRIYNISITKVEESIGDSQNFVDISPLNLTRSIAIGAPDTINFNMTPHGGVPFKVHFFNALGVLSWKGRYLRVTRELDQYQSFNHDFVHGLDGFYSPSFYPVYPEQYSSRNYGG